MRDDHIQSWSGYTEGQIQQCWHDEVAPAIDSLMEQVRSVAETPVPPGSRFYGDE